MWMSYIKIHRIQSGIRNKSHNLNSNHSFDLILVLFTVYTARIKRSSNNKHKHGEKKMLWNVGMLGWHCTYSVCDEMFDLCYTTYKVEHIELSMSDLSQLYYPKCWFRCYYSSYKHLNREFKVKGRIYIFNKFRMEITKRHALILFLSFSHQ